MSSGPFHHGLAIVFTFALVMCLIAAAASWLRGGIVRDESPLPAADDPVMLEADEVATLEAELEND